MAKESITNGQPGQKFTLSGILPSKTTIFHLQCKALEKQAKRRTRRHIFLFQNPQGRECPRPRPDLNRSPTILSMLPPQITPQETRRPARNRTKRYRSESKPTSRISLFLMFLQFSCLPKYTDVFYWDVSLS